MTSHLPGNIPRLQALARLVRYHCLNMTSTAHSGHLTSSLSAADLMTGLLFGGTFRFKVTHPEHPNNDRLIFSKGHASPLFYALWEVAGCIPEKELNSFRHFGSNLEGHPTPRFPYAEAATGSLGQGLGIGLGMALNAGRLDRLPYRTYVLLGDSEMTEGSQWEAIQLAAHYGAASLVGIIDVNRLGQSRETMLGHDTAAYARRVEAFGWRVILIDGHDLAQILDAFREAMEETERPVMIVARTIKGKGISFLEDQDNWHGKALDEEQWKQALREFANLDHELQGEITPPQDIEPPVVVSQPAPRLGYKIGQQVATRKAYGAALKRLASKFPQLVSLDGEVSNSTMSEIFAAKEPERYFEMFIAEQNMVEVALGLALRGKLPFVSTFAAFLTRAAVDHPHMNAIALELGVCFQRLMHRGSRRHDRQPITVILAEHLAAADGKHRVVVIDHGCALSERSQGTARRWIAVGYRGTVLSSPDGSTWTREPTPTTTRLNAIVPGRDDATAYAFGEAGAAWLIRDVNGVWSQRSAPFADRWMRGFSNGVLVGERGTVTTGTRQRQCPAWILDRHSDRSCHWPSARRCVPAVQWNRGRILRWRMVGKVSNSCTKDSRDCSGTTLMGTLSRSPAGLAPKSGDRAGGSVARIRFHTFAMLCASSYARRYSPTEQFSFCAFTECARAAAPMPARRLASDSRMTCMIFA